MIRRLPVLLAAILAAGAYAQNNGTVTSRYGSPSGFGSVLYPGVGHAPQARPPGAITDPTFANRLGATVRGYPAYPGVARGVAHPAHSRQVIVPVPIVVGGYPYYSYDGQGQVPAYGYDPQAVAPQQPVTPPVVIINQSYRPEMAAPRDYYDSPVRRYDTPVHPMPDPNDLSASEQAAPRPRPTGDDKATIYLIAFKDHTILPALAYWIEGDTLNYITQQGTPNRASLTLIDRDFSRQLNRERQVEFNLP